MKKNLILGIIIWANAFISIFGELVNERILAESFPQVFNLSSLNGENGFAINGTSLGSLGFAIKEAGDINDDGRKDILIVFMDGENINKAYVLFGKDEGWPSSISVDDNWIFLNGGMVIIGSNDGILPMAACGVGDINLDGYDDLLFGDVAINNSTGQSYIIFGASEPLPRIKLHDLDGRDGFVINGVNQNDFSGGFVSGLGDVNGDGCPDFIIGTGVRGVKNVTNQIYVVFGDDQNRWPASINLADLDGRNGFVINGVSPNDVGSYSISGVGDVNGDRINDIIIGNPSANNYQGQSYVIFGKKLIEDWPAQFNLADLDGKNGFTINGIAIGDYCGSVVSGVGDVNKDGLDDMLIAAQWAKNYGEIYVVFGDKGPWPAQFNVTSLNGKNGFHMNGVPNNGGYTIGGAGDVNKDGFDDIVIGASSVNNEIGQSYIVFGSEGFKPFLNLTNLDPLDGFTVNGINVGDWSGDSVGSMGDFNKDGIDDFSISASRANNIAGQGYVIYGQAQLGKNRKGKQYARN